MAALYRERFRRNVYNDGRSHSKQVQFVMKRHPADSCHGVMIIAIRAARLSSLPLKVEQHIMMFYCSTATSLSIVINISLKLTSFSSCKLGLDATLKVSDITP